MKQRPPAALLAVLVLVGFLLVVAGTATSAASKHQEPRRQALVEQILDQRTAVDDLDKAVAQLRDQVATERLRVGAASEREQSSNRELSALALQAGTTALSGPGVVVKLSDASRQMGESSAAFDANRIQDGDIQLIVNALFATGAEAIAVNDNRVVAVTPIRAAGGTIVVNYRPVSSPYRIAAIGVDERAFSKTEIAERFRQWEKKFDLGYSVEKTKKVSVPAYSGRVAIDVAHASPVTQGGEG